MAGDVVVLERREDQEERIESRSADNEVMKTAAGQAFHLSRSYVRPSPTHNHSTGQIDQSVVRWVDASPPLRM